MPRGRAAAGGRRHVPDRGPGRGGAGRRRRAAAPGDMGRRGAAAALRRPRRLAIGVARRRPLNVLVVGRLDHAVEPFTDRPARSARNRARNLVCFRTTSSELPRRARFHSRSTHIVKKQDVHPVSSRRSLNRQRGGRGSLSADRLFRITVNKALRGRGAGHGSFTMRARRGGQGSSGAGAVQQWKSPPARGKEVPGNRYCYG